MTTLTKAELANLLFEKVGLNKREAKDMVETFFEEVRTALENGDSVKLSGFGNFQLREKPQRPGRNPKTGEEMPITARRVVTFHASQKLKAMVEEAHVGSLPSSELPPIPPKRYFTIGEVSELCGVKPHVLRYWEQEFNQLKPVKRRGNRRYYQHHEVMLIRRIRELLYEQGFTISGARNRLLSEGDDGPCRPSPLSGTSIAESLDLTQSKGIGRDPRDFESLIALSQAGSCQKSSFNVRRHLAPTLNLHEIEIIPPVFMLAVYRSPRTPYNARRSGRSAAW
jgi:integration host factor subunit alpha